MDSTKAITHVSLCAGYGGIDLGLKRAVAGLRTIAFSEIEAFACANLVAKMEAGCLDAAPIWTDVKTFPWASFRGKVDILSGGYPCQPFSAAGKRLGKDDPRHLWPWIADGIRAMQPGLCFFENVEGHISLGLREVIGELESLGYRTTWGLFSAAEVGAPHQRKRVFIMAHRLCERGQLPDWWRFAAEQMPVGNGATGRNELAFAIQQGPQGSTSKPLHTGGLQSEIGRGCDFAWPSRPSQPQHEWEPPRVVGDAENSKWRTGLNIHTHIRSERNDEFTGSSSNSIVGDAAQLFRNGSNDNAGISNGPQAVSKLGDASWEAAMGYAKSERPAARRSEYERLGGELCASGASDEAMGDTSQRKNDGRESRDLGQTARAGRSGDDATHGAGEGKWTRQTEPALGGDVDGPANRLDHAELYVTSDNRTDELRLLGNGVVPATAERAFRILSSRLLS